MYSCGESSDSNPIIASLNPAPLPQRTTEDEDQSYDLIRPPKERIQKNLFGGEQSDGKHSPSSQEFDPVELPGQHCSDAGGLVCGGLVCDQVQVDDLTHVEGDLACDLDNLTPVVELPSCHKDFINPIISGVVSGGADLAVQESCAVCRDDGECGGHETTQQGHVLHALPTTSTLCTSAPSVSASPGSPHGTTGLLDPITTSPLISTCKTSASFLSPPSSDMTQFLAVQPLLPLNEALLSQTKQAPACAMTAVVGVAGEGLYHVLPVSRPSSGQVFTSASLGCEEVVGSSRERTETGCLGGNTGIEDPGCLGGNTGIEDPGCLGGNTGIEDPGCLGGNTGIEDPGCLRGNTGIEDPGCLRGNTGIEELNNTDTASGHPKTGIKESSDTHAEPNTGCLRETSTDNSTCPKDLAWNSSQNVCRSQGQCKQLPSNLQKCFEPDKWLPKGDIISLAEATADRTHSPQQTIDAFILEGGEEEEEEEEGSGSSTSVHMASLLLSQLESELTNSLNENK